MNVTDRFLYTWIVNKRKYGGFMDSQIVSLLIWIGLSLLTAVVVIWPFVNHNEDIKDNRK